MSDAEDSEIDMNGVEYDSPNYKKSNIDANMKKKNEPKCTKEYFEYHDKFVKKFGYDRTLVLMQVGSFYEAYATLDKGPCLKTLEDLTEACISHKGKEKHKIDIFNPLMWGFPMVASSKFIGILIENGYRLIMVNQVSPKPNIRREVVAIHSPATYLETAYKPASNFVAVICIEEIQQKSNQVLSCVGMSAIDVSTGEVFVHESHSQMNDSKLGLDETIRFLNSLVPKEIVIFKENLQKLTDDFMIEYLELKGKFYQFRDINKELSRLIYQKTILEKVYPDKENMTSIIDTLGLSKTIYARKSLVNLLTYVSDHYENLVRGISEPIFYLSDKYMLLGNDAINQLNIVDNRNLVDVGSVKFNNLLDVVNRASTGMGKRYIKFRLMSPYTSVATLNKIYSIVDIMLKEDLYTTFEMHMRYVHDIERMYRKIALNVLYPMQIVDFIGSFKAIEKIFVLIKDNKHLSAEIPINKFMNSIKKINTSLEIINCEKAKLYSLGDIRENIYKEGVFPELDKLQMKIGDNHEIMEELLKVLDFMIDDNNPNAKGKKILLKQNNRDGYFYQLTSKRFKVLNSKLSKLKTIDLEKAIINVSDFSSVETNQNVKLSLPFLREQTDDIDELIEQIQNIAYTNYIIFLKKIVTDFGGIIEEIIEIITKLDFFATIAKIAKIYNYTRPIINDCQNQVGYIKAEKIRHPIVERIVEHEYVPHDVEIGQSNLKGMLIYGLNSAGKSVLMKAIGINVIMAQAGFFVAAQRFEYYPYKSLYARITGNDNLFRGLSSYSLEIVELNSILKRSNESTLVIGDEVCRGTEHVSGNAIVATTLLKLAELKSTFVFATHLHELMELEEIKSNASIKAFHLSVEHDETLDRLIYDRLLKPGSGERIYGITVAKYIIKDDEFIKKALEIKNRLINRDPNSAALSTKKSRYNNDVIMDCCHICGKREKLGESMTNLETHHINHQKDCDENGFVKSKPYIKKNQIFNLMVVCQTCHDKIHNDEIEIEGIKMTSQGKKVVIKNKTDTNKESTKKVK